MERKARRYFPIINAANLFLEIPIHMPYRQMVQLLPAELPVLSERRDDLVLSGALWLADGAHVILACSFPSSALQCSNLHPTVSSNRSSNLSPTFSPTPSPQHLPTAPFARADKTQSAFLDQFCTGSLYGTKGFPRNRGDFGERGIRSFFQQ